MTGDVTGDVTGNLTGNVTGDVTGNVTGDLTGDVTGNVTGDLTGDVTGTVSDISNHGINALSNVTVPSPTTNDVLQWNGTAWVNVAASTVGATNLDGLSDVVVTSPLQFQGLMYDGTNWVNGNIPNTYLVRNNTGSTLLKGTLVGAVGAEPSGRIDVAPFEVTGGQDSELRAMGIVVSNISNGVNGEVISFGTLTGLDTRGSTASPLAVGDETWAAGDILFAHPTVNGKLTNVRPQHDLAVAFITVRHASTGQIAIRIIPGNNHLEWMHDVSLVDKTSGDFLKYNGTAWVNSGISKSMVGLGSVDNTSDANKPVSTAQQTALNLKANSATPTFTGMVTAPYLTVGGIEIDTTSPSDTNVLKYSSSLNKYIPGVASTVASLDDLTDVIISGATPNQVLKFDGTNWINDDSPSSIAGTTYSVAIGDGSETEFVITHNLSTRNIVVSLTEETFPYGAISAHWEATDLNTATIYFASPPGSDGIRINVYAAVTGSQAMSYATTIGDGVEESYVISHNLGTRDIILQARNVDSPYESYNVAWEATTINTATVYLDSPPAENSIRIKIIS